MSLKSTSQYGQTSKKNLLRTNKHDQEVEISIITLMLKVLVIVLFIYFILTSLPLKKQTVKLYNKYQSPREKITNEDKFSLTKSQKINIITDHKNFSKQPINKLVEKHYKLGQQKEKAHYSTTKQILMDKKHIANKHETSSMASSKFFSAKGSQSFSVCTDKYISANGN